MRVVKERGHSLSSRASRAVWAQRRVEDNELGHWAKRRQLCCLRELSRCLPVVFHGPVGCPGCSNRPTLCDGDDPRDGASEAPVFFKEKLSQHEPRTLRGVKPEDLPPWTDDQEQILPPPPWHQSKANLFRVLIRATPILTCSSAPCFLNASLLFFVLQMITAGWS